MTISIYPIHRAIGRPIQFKGLKGGYILIAAAGLIADLFLFIVLYCCHVPSWICVAVAFGSGAGLFSTCVAFSRKYGVDGLQKANARRRVPSRIEYRSRRSIAEISDDGLISNPCGAITFGFEVTFQGCHQSPETYESLNQTLVKAINPFPAGTTFLQQDRFRRRQWEPADDGLERSFLAGCSDAHFTGRAYYEHKTYFFITRTPATRPVSWGSSALLRRHLVPSPLLDEEIGRTFLEQAAQFEYTIRNGKGCNIRRLSADELRGDGNQPGVIEQYCTLNPSDRLPVLGDVAFERDLFRVLDRHCVIYTLADAEQLPEQCSPWARYHPYSTASTTLPVGSAAWLGPLLECEHVVNCLIAVPDRTKLLTDLERKLKRLNSVSGYARENLRARDDVERFLETAAAGQLSPVRTHIHIVAWTESPEKLPDLKQRVCEAIGRTGATPRLETVGAPQLWYAGIPGNADQLPLQDSWVGFLEQAACFLIKDRLESDSSAGFGIRVCVRHSGLPVNADISDEPRRKQWINNLNKAVLAGSGGGKTYLMLLMVRSYFDHGAHIVIIDIGGSYRRLCSLLKGQYFAYTEQQPIRFNPFRLDKGEGPDTEKKESLISLLLTLWKKHDETFRRSEYVAISNALHRYYPWLADHPDMAPGFNSFYAYLRDEYTAQLKQAGVQQHDFDIGNFLYVLRPYYAGGEYDYLLNAADLPGMLDERLIVFDIDAIKDHPILFPVVTIIIMEVFISKMRRLHGLRKVIIIEEAWKAIAKQGMDEYVRYLFKTVRKFFGEAIVVTQEIEDIISSPVVRNTIINNTDLKILPDQGKLGERFDQLQKALGLSDHEKAAAASVNKSLQPGRKYKEAAFCYANGPCQVYAIETSLEEYLAFTSEETERVLVDRYAAQEGGMENGIRRLSNAIRSGAVKLFLLVLLLFPHTRSDGQVLEVIDVVNAAVKKVIETADLEVQRLQTQTIVLQDAEKELENSMAGDLLDDITDWVEQQEQLYGAYYQELWQVKSALNSFSKAATLIDRQAALVREEQRDWAAVQQDPHFTLVELEYIAKVYSGILNESARNVQQISLVIQSFVTQMDDAGRLAIIDETNRSIDGDFSGLRAFTQQNSLLSLQRARDQNDVLTIKQLYNLP
jgi:conjugation system TraG family ATPase